MESRYQLWAKSEEGQAYLNGPKRELSRRLEQDQRKFSRIAKAAYVRKIKLDKGCQKCRYKAHYGALQFHHRNPEEKIFAIARYQNFSWAMIVTEIAKCDILCANCHAIVEFEKDSSVAGASGNISPF